MAVTATPYNAFLYRQLGDTSVTPINLKTDTIKIALLSSSYTPDFDAHDFFNDITNEVTGTGYTAGGVALTVTTSQDNTDNEGVADATDPSWNPSTITARYAVIYKDTGTASTSPLIGLINFGTDVSATAGEFKITLAAEGFLNFTSA